MATTLEVLKTRFALQLYRRGMLKDKTQSPTGKGFKLKLHERIPGAPLSPYYLDLRMLRSYPELGGVKDTAVELFQELIKNEACDVIADIPQGITPIVSTLSDKTGIPMITPRAPKRHGTEATIDGVYHKGDMALLFDDLIALADSKIEAALVLRENGLIVKKAFVLVDREQGWRQAMAQNDLELHAAITVTEILDLNLKQGTLSQELYDEIRTYRSAQV